MVQPGGPSSQRFISSGLVWQSQIRLRGASKLRLTTISRSDGMVTSTGVGIVSLLGVGRVARGGLQLIEQVIEPLVIAFPDRSVMLDPGIGFLQRGGLDPA